MSSFYCNKSPIDLIVMSNDRKINDELHQISPIISNCTSYSLSSNVTQRHPRKSNVIAILNDLNEFSDLIKTMTSDTFDYRGYYTIVFLNKHVELDSAFKIAWNNSIININAITLTSAEWRVWTFYPFSNGTCGNTKAVTADTKHLFPDKIKNLHECPLKFPKFNYFPGLIIQQIGNETILSGIDGDIMMKGLIKNFNFSIQILQMKNENERWGYINENGNHTGAVRMVIQKEADLMLGFMALTHLRLQYMDSTDSFISLPFVLVVPPGSEFTPFQKLFRPFSIIVWIFVLLTIVYGFFFIFFTQMCGSTACNENVFGEYSRVPYLFMMNVIFGGTLHRLPSKSVPRLLLISFIVYCLVMRTLYQGSLFKFLQSNDRQSPVMTVDDLMERNYDVYMYPVYLEHSKHMKFFSRRKLITDSEAEKYLKMTLNPNFKGAITSSLDEVMYLNKINHKSFTYRVLPEYLYSFNNVIYFQKHSPYLKAFNEKMSLYKSAGLIDYWVSEYLTTRYLNIREQNFGPRKLYLDQLQGGFEIWLIGCVVSSLVLVFEIFCNKFMQRQKVHRHKSKYLTTHKNISL